MKNNITKLASLLFAAPFFLVGCEPDVVTYNGGDFAMFDPAAESTVYVSEGVGTLLLPVVLTTPQSGDVTVNFTVTADTAVEGTDYSVVTPSLVIPAGETEGNIQIAIVNNDEFNTSVRFNVVLTGTSSGLQVGLGGQVGSYQKTIVIANDDCPTQFMQWFGNLTVEDVGYPSTTGVGAGNDEGDCDVLKITGDLGGFGISTASFLFYFTPDFEGSTAGSIDVPEQIYCDGCSSSMDVFYSATGSYDAETSTITVDYSVRREDDAGYTGQNIIYPAE